MSDCIFLRGMEFAGRHGVSDEERSEAQVIELDVELQLDLRQAGLSDDLAQTVDYAEVFELCRAIVEERSFRLLEGMAEQIAAGVLERFHSAERVVITVRKPGVPLDGIVEHAGVTIERDRA
jgi:7,8-dihydroneopterin aldolase/epimerase/oxygenase